MNTIRRINEFANRIIERFAEWICILIGREERIAVSEEDEECIRILRERKGCNYGDYINQ